MPPESASVTSLVLQGGAAGALMFVLAALKLGWLATRQEVTAMTKEVEATRKEIDAWKSRVERAEKQVDTLLPAIETLTRAVLERARTT